MIEAYMKRITFIFIVLSLNSIAGYFLKWPLSMFLLKPLINGLDWHPLSALLFIGIPFSIAFPIVLGDAIFRICVAMQRHLNVKDAAKMKARFDKFLDGIVLLCVIIMLIAAAIPPHVKSFAFDKRRYVFDQMHSRYRGLPVYEKEYSRKFRQINDFNGTILQDAGADGLWNTSDDVIRLEPIASDSAF